MLNTEMSKKLKGINSKKEREIVSQCGKEGSADTEKLCTDCTHLLKGVGLQCTWVTVHTLR